jgi:hypothetical protein
VKDVPEAPAKQRRKRRIIIEQSSSDSGSADEEIVWQRNPRRARRPTPLNSRDDVDQKRPKRKQQVDDGAHHFVQLRALGLV